MFGKRKTLLSRQLPGQECDISLLRCHPA